MCLVMKTLKRRREAEFDLRRRLSDVGGIAMDNELTAAEVSGPYEGGRDCSVFSPIREFGLGMAEAMYFEVRAIGIHQIFG